MKSKEDIKPVEVFAGDIWETGLVKSLLEDAEIETFLQDEFRGTLAPWQVAPGGAGAIKVIVSDNDYERAKQVVEEYYRNINK
jgi:hypothetical protein